MMSFLAFFEQYPKAKLLAYMSGLVIHLETVRSMRGGFIFRNRGPSLKVHRGQCLKSMTKHD
jgi:hypothetical protein